MGITERMNQVAASMQNTAKSTGSFVTSMVLKSISALVISLVVALVAQTLIGFGQLSFLFTLVVGISLLMRLMWKWSIGVTLVFDLVCVLVALVLRMYILLAP